MGWSMHMGRLFQLRDRSETPEIEFPDGHRETAYSDIDSQVSTHITKSFLKYDQQLHAPFPNGGVWTFVL